jgi:transcriptional regulator with XRE-family HTH domain
LNLLTELRIIRQGRKISQQELALDLGLNSQSGLSCLETGKRSPNLSTLIEWAGALGYELALRPKE